MGKKNKSKRGPQELILTTIVVKNVTMCDVTNCDKS